jgi:RimJ/RimL family protein N-acetyltransferase
MRFFTERLVSIPLSSKHKGYFCRLYQDPAVMRYIALPLSHERAEKTFQQALQGNTTIPFTCLTWCLFERGANTIGNFIGNQGLIWKSLQQDVCDAGIMLDSSAFGKGFAAEGMGALVDFAFNHLGLNRINCQLNADNLASKGFLVNLGFVFNPQRENHGIQQPVLTCCIDKKAWLASDQRVKAEVNVSL